MCTKLMTCRFGKGCMTNIKYTFHGNRMKIRSLCDVVTHLIKDHFISVFMDEPQFGVLKMPAVR